MIEHRELISICRQIGSMMEAGVDILRVTRVLRAQTDNPKLLAAYDTLDHDLRMGQGLADAMERAPEIFSPFAVSLVRQGEARNDIAGAFYKIADFLQKEDEVAVTHQNDGLGGVQSTPAPEAGVRAVVTPSTLLPVWVIDDLISRAQVAALRIFTVIAGLLLTLAAVWASVEAGFVERRWQNVVLCSVAALFIGGAGMWLRRRIEEDSKREHDRRHIIEAQVGRAGDGAVHPTHPNGSDDAANPTLMGSPANSASRFAQADLPSEKSPVGAVGNRVPATNAVTGVSTTREATFE